MEEISIPTSWDGKVIVITGASRGIGATFAKQAATKGASVVLTARSDEVRAVAEECGPNAIAVIGDVTQRSHHQEILDAALQRFGHVDVWINNAGQGISKSTLELTDDDFDWMMAVNVKSALYGMQTVLPHFMSRNSGHLINISSMLGRVPFAAPRSAYCAAKHALNALTTTLRTDVRREGYTGICISTVLPGPVQTEFGVRSLNGGADNRLIPNSQPVEEVAEVICKTIDERLVDVYTRPAYHDSVVNFYRDIALAESSPPFVMPAKPRPNPEP